MPKRSYSGAGSYRYGFNGKENDNDVKGLGNQQDYGMRIYDPRLGKFLSVDPIAQNYPQLTPFQFASNTPIWATDLDGLEANFNNAKVPKAQYVDYGMGKFFNVLGNFQAFGANVGASAVNQTIDVAEVSVNSLSSKGREKIMKETIEPAFIGFLQWQTLSPEEQLKSIKDFLSDPKNLDELGGSFLLLFSGKFFPKLSAPKALEPYLNSIKQLFSSEKKILSLQSVEGLVVNRKIIAKVTEHLKRFGVHAENTIMINRLKNIEKGVLKPTEIDLNFLKHELREAQLVNEGYTPTQAHEIVLKEQGMFHRGYDKKLYTKEALEAGDKEWKKATLKKDN